MAQLSTASHLAWMLSAGEARALESEFIDTEHLLLGLLKIEDLITSNNDDFPEISAEEWETLILEVSEFKDFLAEKGVNCKSMRRNLRRGLHENQPQMKEFSGHRTPRCREVFAQAEEICRYEKATTIRLKHLLSAVLNQESRIIAQLLAEFSVDKKTLQVKEQEYHADAALGEAKGKDAAIDFQKGNKTRTPFLEKFGRDLTQLARDGKLDPVIGRKEEMRKIAQILLQQKKNNPLLVGDAGVGKTCIVEGLAQKIVALDAPAGIRNLMIYEINMGGLVSGTKYRGDFEERIRNMIKEASSDPNIVLFIDEIHTMMGAGSAGGSMDAANILKPALARGEIKCIGATTTAEYRRYIEKDPALERRFQLIWVDEPTVAEAIQILTGVSQNFEKHHGIRIPEQVIKKAVELSMRYLPDFRLPDKAVDLIDQACACKVLKTISPVDLTEDGILELTVADLAKIVAERCRVPIENLTAAESERLLNMEKYLSQRVMGQDRAVKEVAETIRAAKAGLKEPHQPVGVFLFLGSTGTGKTELAKALADFLFDSEKHLLTIDMSEYQAEHSISKLIGAPPGYVGYEEEGFLTGKIRTNPYSVVLFDEIEKAHPKVFDLFLQIFEEGRLTDGQGRRVNFAEAVIILTSNLGAGFNQGMLKRAIGIDLDKSAASDSGATWMEKPTQAEKETKWKNYEANIHQALGKTLRPELINRIQKKIIFYPLSRQTVIKIIDNIIDGFNQRLIDKDLKLKFTEAAKEFLIQNGYDEKYGARELKRTFDRFITEPLSQKILQGEIKNGRILEVIINGNTIAFKEND